MADPHDIPLDARRYWLLLSVHRRLRDHTPLTDLLPEGSESIQPGDPDDLWEDGQDALLVYRITGGSTGSAINGEVPEYQVQVILEWSFEHHDKTQHFWEARVFDAVDDALSQFSPGQYTGLGAETGIDAQPDDQRNRYLTDQMYRFRTRLN